MTKTCREESSEHTDGESDANVLKSRQFVYKELLATEKVYIEDLKTVLNVSQKHAITHGIMESSIFSLNSVPDPSVQSYYDAMDPEESTSIPLRLRDKRHVVFGNLPEIHKFHEE